jgi:quercetin dioxygenase-like cupin family protein
MSVLGTPSTIIQPGEGVAGELVPGVGVVFKLSGEDTGGALAIVEHSFEVGALVPPHVHTREDEYSVVLDGEIGFRSGDREAVLGPGGYITKPRGELHTVWNAGSTPGRMIEVISPAGFENFFRELVALFATAPPEFDAVVEIAARYGLRFEDAEWVPEIIGRYGLSPPPS